MPLATGAPLQAPIGKTRMAQPPTPGPIILFGSGETSPSGRKVFERVLKGLPPSPQVALLETPAGFELNSAQVIERVADFIRHRLQNFSPQVQVIPARQRGTPFSPDRADLLQPLLHADLIFMGPGSPTYAVRQLHASLAWQMLLARHRLGAALVLASAATIAFSVYALPVYEIYKVGEELHWKPGLDFFGLYGLPLVFIPHWNNTDGGPELDTSRCFMGQPRFARLMEMLPPTLTVIGIDEKTALVMEPGTGQCHVGGMGSVTLIHTGHDHPPFEPLPGQGLHEVASQRQGHVHIYHSGESFALHECAQMEIPVSGDGLPAEIWQAALAAHQAPQAPASPDPATQALLEQRQAARARQDWAASDHLRSQIVARGWEVRDTPAGQQVTPIDSK